MIIEAAVSVTAIAVEELPAEFPGDCPVFFGFVLSPILHVALGLRIVDEQIDLFSHDLFLAQSL
jgi:hypothetical protein